MGQFGRPIEQIVDLLNLERNPRGTCGKSFDVKCPFCANAKGYHLNINTEKDVFKCFVCDSSGGTLTLYKMVRHGPGAHIPYKELYIEMLKDLGEYEQGSRTIEARTDLVTRENYEILPASDDMLHKAYSAMLSLPYLALSDEHRRNLLNRGLTQEDIARNGYATMPAEYKPDGFSKWLIWYEKNGIEEERLNNQHLRYSSKESFILGFKIAKDLVRMGVSLDNIPGFFKVKDKFYCVRTDVGILIPTRSVNGHIVGIQTRRDVPTGKGLRYMTLSSKGLPGGVTDNIARTHFPLSNAPTSQSVQVLLTEGPLKADVALSLLRRMGYPNTAFIALQGVAATRELPQIADLLQGKGVTTVFNAFDMDKLVNVNVMRAMVKSSRTLEKAGLESRVLLWGTDFIRYKLNQMRELAEQNNLRYEVFGSISEDFRELSQVLTRAGIDYDFYVSQDTGELIADRWLSTDKGIDDHLANFLKSTGLN